MQIGGTSFLLALKNISPNGAPTLLKFALPMLLKLATRMASNFPMCDDKLVTDLMFLRLNFIMFVRLESRRAGARHRLVGTPFATLYFAFLFVLETALRWPVLRRRDLLLMLPRMEAAVLMVLLLQELFIMSMVVLSEHRINEKLRSSCIDETRRDEILIFVSTYCCCKRW
jgi:hypothetical protein